VYDLGSGLLADPSTLGLPGEPRAPDALRSGTDLVVISGDKLLGGPQAGIVLGRRDLVDAMRHNPLCRALRVDKVTLAGLEATLRLYRDPEEAVERIPTLRMLAAPLDELEARARSLATRLEAADVAVDVAPGNGAVGGGTYPEITLPSWTVRIRSSETERIAAALRAGDPPVVARIHDDRVVLDVRTVGPGEDDDLVRAVRDAVRGPGSGG
jgi:L-seryl-tRNA(Ser) seleniumtransferase